MFKPNTEITFFEASVEILTMLVVAFILGYLLRWVLEKYFLKSTVMPAAAPAMAAAPAEAVAATPAVTPLYTDQNDLKVVEGIGPAIEKLLKADNINTWGDLGQASQETLKNILEKAGDRFRMHNPETWSEQAGLAHNGQWSELEEYQDFLNGGKLV